MTEILQHREKLMEDVTHSHKLHHVDTNEKYYYGLTEDHNIKLSHPQKSLCAEVQCNDVELRHPHEIHDASAPNLKIDKDIRIGKNEHSKLFSEIKDKPNLHHVELSSG